MNGLKTDADKGDPLAGGCAVPFTVLAALIVYLLFDNKGKPGQGETAIIFVIAMTVVLLDFRKAWKQVWFWGAVAFLFLIHAIVLFSFSWPRTDYDGQSLGGAVLVDVLLCVGLIKLCQRLIRRSAAKPE